MSVFDAVKEAATTKEAAEKYGLKTSSSGMICCPFHPDKNPSMKVDKRFHCFGCQADGDVIDFTARLFNLDRKEAAIRLAEDFNIPYDGGSGREQKENKRVKKQIRKDEVKVYGKFWRWLQVLDDQEKKHAPIVPEEDWDRQFCVALQKKTYIKYALSVLENGTEEEKRELMKGMENLRKEHENDPLKMLWQNRTGNPADSPVKQYSLYDLDSIESLPVDWLWYPYIPFGMITIIQGDPGCGKTMLMLTIIAHLSKGLPLFDQEEANPPVVCIYQTAEDSLKCTVKPRLETAGADCSNVKIIDESKELLTFCDSRLERVIEDTGAKLLVLDPLQAYLGADVDMHRANEVRPVFHHLSEMAERTGCAVVLVGHMNKMKELSSIYRGLGSIDIAGAARSIILVTKPQIDDPEIYFSHVKSNVGPKGETLVFTIEDNHIAYQGTTEVSADQALEGKKGDLAIQATKVQQVITILEDYFREMKEISVKEATDYFLKQGISQRTVATAKKEMKLIALKRGNAWYWSKGRTENGEGEISTDGAVASGEAHGSETRVQG